MRIPFPERIPIHRAALVAVVFFVIQRVEGTALYFCTGCLVFVLLTTVAFNVSGGLARASGAYIFFYSVLVVLIGLGYKAFLGEPAQSNLADPRTDIEVYVGGMAVMLAAAFASRRFSRRSGLLQYMLSDSQMYRSSVGCMVFGVAADFAINLMGESAEWLSTAFGQLNQLIPLGIIIGVIYEIRRSGGRRCINLPVLIGAGYFFGMGVLNFAKQGMLTPLFCWLLPVWAMQYRLSRVQVLGGLLSLFVIFHYLVPYAQYGRAYLAPDQTFADRLAIALPLLEHAEATREAYYEEQDMVPGGGLNSYYNTPQGFWERLQFISVDDALINATDQGKVFGYLPLKLELLNTVPHIFWPDKPMFNLGNTYAHELGDFSPEDTTTGISFSPTSEAYHMGKWSGLLVVAPILWFVFFVTFDSLFGDLRATPWGLLVIVSLAHYAPETALSGIIHLLTFGVEILVFCAVFATWGAPVIASAILGPERSSQSNSPHSRPSTSMLNAFARFRTHRERGERPMPGNQ